MEDKILGFQFETVSTKPTRPGYKFRKLGHFAQKVKQDSLGIRPLQNLHKAYLEFTEGLQLYSRPDGLQLYQKETPTQVFSCKYCEIVKNSFLYRTPLMAASRFLTKLAENNCEENHFSVVFHRNFLEIISQSWQQRF